MNISKSLGKSSSSHFDTTGTENMYAEGNASTERTVHITQCHKPSEMPETIVEVPEKFKNGAILKRSNPWGLKSS